jgi:hypothetical protein
MDRVVRGEKNILTAEDPILFARTSGTTGAAKYIPVTPTCQGRDHADQMRTWTYHASTRHPRMFRGQVISLVSPAVEGYTEARIPYGSTSGYIYKNMPRLIRRAYAIPYELFLIEDFTAKYYALMRVAIGAAVTFLGTANPSSIVMMVEFADDHADELLRDLADGTLRKDLEIPGGPRAAIESRLRKDPDRARDLEQKRKKRSGKLLPIDYWPELALIGCWKGGPVGVHIEKLTDWFDPDGTGMVSIRDWGYLASEARGSIPLSDHGSGGALTVSTNVFEFVPVENLEENLADKNAWEFLGVDEIETDREYYVFFTTTGGLYRYDINDIVEVVGRYNNTPIISFRRKGRGMTNITGEKLSVNQVITAFDNVSRALDVPIEHFRAEADIGNSRYVFKVEARKLPDSRRRELLYHLDRELSDLNIEYAARRDSMRLKDPVLHVMKAGWHKRLKEALVADGKGLFQAKSVLLDAGGDPSTGRETPAATVELDRS